MAFGIGTLNERITLRSPTLTPDGAGGQRKGTANVATVWANVMAGSGREAFRENRTTGTAMVMFTIRLRSDVQDTWSILWDGVVYNVREIKREGDRPRLMRIMAERGVAA